MASVITSGKKAKVRKLNFKFNFHSDAALLQEVNDLLPFASAKPFSVWTAIAKNLKESEGHYDVTARTCKDRLSLLILKYKSEERASLKRSGTEEDFSEFLSLLQLVTSASDDATILQNLGCNVSERELASAERDIVTENFAVRDMNVDLGGVSDEGPELDDIAAAGPNKIGSITSPQTANTVKKNEGITKKKSANIAVIQFLETKHKSEVELKKEELKIREFEANNRKDELEIQKVKQDQDGDAKKQELNTREMEAKNKAEELVLQRMKLEMDVKEKQQMLSIMQATILKLSDK